MLLGCSRLGSRLGGDRLDDGLGGLSPRNEHQPEDPRLNRRKGDQDEEKHEGDVEFRDVDRRADEGRHDGDDSNPENDPDLLVPSGKPVGEPQHDGDNDERAEEHNERREASEDASNRVPEGLDVPSERSVEAGVNTA